MDRLPEIVDGLPNICGAEQLIDDTMQRARARAGGSIDFSRVRSAFAIALHMHEWLLEEWGMIVNLNFPAAA